ncbi:hypothetical protein [Corynebacterium glutamicum]|uniref:hypothetical protein n=1 Tax=Corynebacterium glutamicum TaxID=1718 RepID=UPI001B8CFEE3|nr:hypothetical protein [Corynebacterium glutamicum]
MERISESLKPIIEALEKAWCYLTDALIRTQKRQTQRAYRELATPPVDHPHSHVTHTRTKPPAPARIYRRRTLSSPADAPAGRAPVGGGHGHTRENI